MNILAVLIPAALLLGLLGLMAFLWSLGAGQFDDLDGAAVRILDDDPPRNRAAVAAPETLRPTNATHRGA